ncbi:unnamed protein product [Dibothriocephalus latus]|uniref:G-protein coupled receptors family 1 profile domain-containing protein n=1 Tax=Dibothriocephalus latus TaxID=60516 RepID=A0A3P7M935_DIBLA|nr:unnamed protein product [Dibothriocephalus latus]
MLNLQYLNDCKELPPVVLEDARITVSLLVCSSFAILLELIALIVLARHRAKRFGSMRKSLIALTSIEMWLNTSIFVHKVWEDYGSPHPETLLSYILAAILFSLLNSAICSRNWCVTLIALSRCEAITRPLAHRSSKQLLSPNRQLILLVFVIILGIIFSAVRLTFLNIVVCTNLNNTVIRLPPANSTNAGRFEKVFFAYQSAIPISIVALATVFMIWTLLRPKIAAAKRTPSSPEIQRQLQCPSTAHGSHNHGKILPRGYEKRNVSRLTNQVRATRTIFFIAAVFTVLEAPVFFIIVFENHIGSDVRVVIVQLLKFLIILDSYTNIAIYLLTSEHFRTELIRMLTCGRYRTEKAHSRIRNTKLAIQRPSKTPLPSQASPPTRRNTDTDIL